MYNTYYNVFQLLRKGFVKVKVVEGGPIPAVELFLEDTVVSALHITSVK